MAGDPSTRLSSAAQAYEQAIQDVAYELMRDRSAYEQAQQLVAAASDAAKLRARVEQILTGSSSLRTERRSGATSRSVKKASKYPLFFVRQDRLIKIGRGKKKTAKEYRHETPRASFDVVARWIEEATVSGRQRWLAREADEQLRGSVPTYQVYLVVAALQSVGLLEQPRRGEYLLANDAGRPDEWWATLQSLPSPEGEGGAQ
ncbi:MAG: hypothetical protein IBX63_09965 [Coriobacteriia bacterium]|nr:hypothetical protein [Coriobacteriia bacterium]